MMNYRLLFHHFAFTVFEKRAIISSDAMSMRKIYQKNIKERKTEKKIKKNENLSKGNLRKEASKRFLLVLEGGREPPY